MILSYETYLKESTLSEERSDADSDLKRSMKDNLLNLEEKTNSQMRDFNNILCSDSLNQPRRSQKLFLLYTSCAVRYFSELRQKTLRQ